MIWNAVVNGVHWLSCWVDNLVCCSWLHPLTSEAASAPSAPRTQTWREQPLSIRFSCLAFLSFMCCSSLNWVRLTQWYLNLWIFCVFVAFWCQLLIFCSLFHSYCVFLLFISSVLPSSPSDHLFILFFFFAKLHTNSSRAQLPPHSLSHFHIHFMLSFSPYLLNSNELLAAMTGCRLVICFYLLQIFCILSWMPSLNSVLIFFFITPLMQFYSHLQKHMQQHMFVDNTFCLGSVVQRSLCIKRRLYYI